MSGNVTIEHARVGPVEVKEEEVLNFEGLPGFPDARRFAVLDHSSDSPFSWLVSLDDVNLAFVVANPWNFFPDYDPAIGVADVEKLALKTREETEIIVIATIEGENVWMNLAAPLLINRSNRRAMQVVTEGSRYSTRESMPKLEEISQAQQAEAQRGEPAGTSAE